MLYALNRECEAIINHLKLGKLQINKLIKQNYQQSRLKSSFLKFYDQYNDLVSKKSFARSYIDCCFFFKILIVKPLSITELSTDLSVFPIRTKITQRVWPVSWDAHSTMAPDHTSFVKVRDWSSPILYFSLDFWFETLCYRHISFLTHMTVVRDKRKIAHFHKFFSAFITINSFKCWFSLCFKNSFSI